MFLYEIVEISLELQHIIERIMNSGNGEMDHMCNAGIAYRSFCTSWYFRLAVFR